MTNYWDTPEDELHYQRQIDTEHGKRVKIAGSLFYLVAGLSFLNAILLLVNLSFADLAGLGITSVFYTFANYVAMQSSVDNKLVFLMVYLSLSAATSAVYALLGKYVKKSRSWALHIGTTIYIMDMLFYIWYANLMGLVFHIYVIIQLKPGIIALRQLLSDPRYDDADIRRAELH